MAPLTRLVRPVVRDDAEQTRAAEEFIANGAWVSHLLLAETARVLDVVSERSAEQIATAIEMLLDRGCWKSQGRPDTCLSVLSIGTSQGSKVTCACIAERTGGCQPSPRNDELPHVA